MGKSFDCASIERYDFEPKKKVSNPCQWRHDIPLPMCLMLCVNTFRKGHGFKLVLYSVRGFTILSVLQCLSPCLSTLSLSSTAATNHYKNNQLFIVASLTGDGPTYLSGCSPQALCHTFPALSELLYARSFITALSSSNISLNIRDVRQSLIRDAGYFSPLTGTVDR